MKLRPLPSVVAQVLRRLAVGLGLLVAVVSLAAALTPLPSELRTRRATQRDSVRVLDRNGRLVREVRTDDWSRAVTATRRDLGEVALHALLAAEDRRFHGHIGVDPVSVLRAAVSNVAERRIVSGASTLTMQLARLVSPHRRTFVDKAREALLALRIEASLDKETILVEYANRAPFGPGVRGLRAASHHYFDKEPTELSVGEAALLASIPKGPAVYDPRRFPQRAASRRDRVLARMERFGIIDAGQRRIAEAEPVHVLRVGRRSSAVQFVSALLSGALDGLPPPHEAGAVRSSLDGDLQREVEQAVAAQVRTLAERHVTAGAALVIDNATGQVLAYVGSPDPFDRARGGFNDGVRARRQAGSTLKPFLYGLAFDRDEIDAASVLADVPLTVELPGGAFVPANYDGKFHGPVRARVALASSLNVPAVALAERVGVTQLLETLRHAGFSLAESPEHYGAALALGDGDVTLLELVRAYAALARGGETLTTTALLERRPGPESAPARVLSPASAWLVADILADKEARLPGFGEGNVLELPFRAAIKTGTSKGFRDNWAVGFTDRVTAGVWVGNFDGSSMENVSGVSGAGPILRTVLAVAHDRAMHTLGSTAVRSRSADASAAPAEDHGFEDALVCPLSGERPGPDCPHAVHEKLPRARASARRSCTMHVHVLVEKATGALASPRCGASLVERRTFEDMPPALLGWAREAHRPLLPEVTSTSCPPSRALDSSSPTGAPGLGGRTGEASAELPAALLRIEHPAPNARYYFEPSREFSSQTIGVRVRAPRRASYVALRVDGREVARARPGDVLPWSLAPGRHTLIAEAPGITSAPIHVDVD